MGETFGSSVRARTIFVLVNIVAIGFLVWSLRHFDFRALVEDLHDTNWWWISLAIVSDIAVYAAQALRWRVLLHPVEPVPFWQSIRAVYIGLFGNEVLGFAAGEVVRCYVIARFTSLPFSVSLSSALIERIFDGVWLSAGLILTLRSVGLPHRLHWIVDGAYVLGTVVLIAALLLGFTMFHRIRARAALQGGSWKKHLRVLIDDLSLIGHSRYLYFAFLLSLPYLVLQLVPIWATFRGFGFYDLGLWDAFALMVILRMAMAVPQAPGNIGFLLLTRELMKVLFNTVPRDGENFALLLWALVTLRVVLGAIALATTGSKFGELHRAAHTQRAELSKTRDSVATEL